MDTEVALFEDKFSVGFAFRVSDLQNVSEP